MNYPYVTKNFIMHFYSIISQTEVGEIPVLEKFPACPSVNRCYCSISLLILHGKHLAFSNFSQQIEQTSSKLDI